MLNALNVTESTIVNSATPLYDLTEVLADGLPATSGSDPGRMPRISLSQPAGLSTNTQWNDRSGSLLPVW